MSQERRRHLRTATDGSYFVGCKSPEKDEPNLAVRLIDVGALGACFVSREKLRSGLRVRMLVVQPASGTRASVDAVVRWSTTLESKGQVAHVTGVEFERDVPALDGGAVRRPASKPAKSSKPDPQRKHKRFSPKDTRLVCVPSGSRIAKLLGLRSDVACGLKDLSLTGAQIVSRRKLKAGQQVEISILLPDGKTKIETEAVVRWCRRDTLSLRRRYLTGLLFGKIDDGARHYLTSAQVAFAR